MQVEDQEKLYTDVLKADLDTYRKYETWGSSLFLGAQGLLAKQLFDWELNPHPQSRIPLTMGLVILIVTVGFVAFFFLCVVNFQGYRCGRELRDLAGRRRDNKVFCRSLPAQLFASMPLLLALGVFWLFAVEKPDYQWWLRVVLIGAVVAFVADLSIQYKMRKALRKA